MIFETDPVSEKQLGLSWLIRLRWIAVLGQCLVCLVASIGYGILLPVTLFGICIGLTAASNLLLSAYKRRHGGGKIWVKALILSLDVIVLTIMLFFAGGAHNPFTMFYLLHVTMAVILLPPAGAWGTVALSTIGFWTLFYSNYPLKSSCGYTCCNDMDAHLRGMVIGMVLTGCGISYFVSRLTAGLKQSRKMIAAAQADGEQARRCMEVATLAAGLAHELATPLGTIAVVSQDFETLAGTQCGNTCCLNDARTIRQEVERCRGIIEKLGHMGREPEESLKPLPWNHLADLLDGYLPESVLGRVETRIRQSNKRPLLPSGRLFQCLSILIKNAAEASPPDTAIILHAEILDDHCMFQVIDHGPGFPDSILDRIGEPLVTTKSKQGGLGLGLFLVKSFVNQMGGEFTVDNARDTTVSIKLPLLLE